MADETSDQDLRKYLQILQSMIDVSAERLEGLRTQCATSAELTQQEIRTLEVNEDLLYLTNPDITLCCQFSGKADKDVLRSACYKVKIKIRM